MEAAPTIPQSPDDLTTEWLNDVFRATQIDAAVRHLDTAAVGTGQMASSIRLHVDYDTNPSDLPPSFVVKLASSDPNSRGAGARGAYLREVRFYEHLADKLAVATPACWWSAIDEQTNDFVLLLENMAPARQGDQIAGASVDQVHRAALNIAGLHAPTWNDHELLAHAWLTPPADQRAARSAELQQMLELLTPGFIDRYSSRLTPAHVDLLQWFAKNAADYLEASSGEPFAGMHGDHRLDNLLFNDARLEQPVTVVDWQTVALRNPVADISYLLGTSLEPAERRAHEQDLVDAYFDELVALGVTGYERSDCVADYRTNSLHALILTVAGSMLTIQTDRGDEMFMAMLTRSAAQIADLDAR